MCIRDSYNPYLRERIAKEASLSHYNDMNVLSMHALIGAYRPEGYEWVDELCQVLGGNVLRLRLYRRAFQGGAGLKATGYLYALSGLQRVVRGPRQNH